MNTETQTLIQFYTHPENHWLAREFALCLEGSSVDPQKAIAEAAADLATVTIRSAKGAGPLPGVDPVGFFYGKPIPAGAIDLELLAPLEGYAEDIVERGDWNAVARAMLPMIQDAA